MFAWIVIGAGALLLLISVFADPLGLGRHPGLGWIQGLGVVIGALVILAGFYLRRRKASPYGISTSIPIVAAIMGDPVGDGLVAVALGLLGGQRPSLADYVTVTGPTDGALAAGEC